MGKSNLITKLENCRTINATFISSENYWHYIDKLNVYPTSLIQVSCDDTYNINNDNEFIIMYSQDFYNEDKLNELKSFASKISRETNKRVSIGYSYTIPEKERECPNIREEIKFMSIKGNDVEELTFGMDFFIVPDFIEIVVETHDYLESQKVLKK